MENLRVLLTMALHERENAYRRADRALAENDDTSSALAEEAIYIHTQYIDSIRRLMRGE